MNFGSTRSISFGHVISKEVISVDQMKIEDIVNLPRPTNVAEVRSFLGMAGYYRRFIEGFSKIALPITRLIRKAPNLNGRMNVKTVSRN